MMNTLRVGYCYNIILMRARGAADLARIRADIAAGRLDEAGRERLREILGRVRGRRREAVRAGGRQGAMDQEDNAENSLPILSDEYVPFENVFDLRGGIAELTALLQDPALDADRRAAIQSDVALYQRAYDNTRRSYQNQWQFPNVISLVGVQNYAQNKAEIDNLFAQNSGILFDSPEARYPTSVFARFLNNDQLPTRVRDPVQENYQSVSDKIRPTKPLFQGVVRHNEVEMGNYWNVGSNAGSIPISKKVPPGAFQNIVANELYGIPPKPISELRVQDQFGDVIRSVVDKLDTDLYRKQEQLISYKSRIVMDVFDAMRAELQKLKTPVQTGKYMFSRYYDVYDLGKTFGVERYYPIHVKIKFDKDSNPIGDNDSSGFGVYLGNVVEGGNVYRMIPFGKKKRAAYEFKVAPYFGYVNSIFGVLRRQASLGAAPFTVSVYNHEGDNEVRPELNQVVRVNLNLTTPSSEITPATKFSIWLGSLKDDQRPFAVASREYVKAVNDMVWNEGWARVLLEHMKRLGTAFLLINKNLKQEALTQYLEKWSAAVLGPDDLAYALTLPQKMVNDLMPNAGAVPLDRQIKMNDLNGNVLTYDTIGAFVQSLEVRLNTLSATVVEYLQDFGSKCFLHIPHTRLVRYPTQEQAEILGNTVGAYYRKKLESIPVTLVASGFTRLSDFIKYIGLMGWIRNFIYALKQERTKISQQRVRKYVKSDSKNLQKLVYTFGGEPSKMLGYN